MFKKICPWCEKEISPYQLGNRPSIVKPKWFHLTRNIQVCPYCANPVKLSGKGFYWLLLVIPAFVLNLLKSIFSKELSNITNINVVFIFIAIVGLSLAFLMSKFVKETRI